MPSFKAIGSRPINVAPDVINTGRKRTRQASETASRTGRTISIHRFEAILQRAREEQADPAWKVAYRADRPIAVTDPLSHTTTTVYDAADRNIASISPLGCRMTNTYDAGSRKIRLTVEETGVSVHTDGRVPVRFGPGETQWITGLVHLGHLADSRSSSVGRRS